ncbi:DNA replication/repair protein RecF [Lentisalinibacter salinarum]|uniref:DNA replication/repair protein RecF n=1 Tax=Lentisalinibacter salinarum TaxID=2992239 RepID=UPI003869E574
MSLIRVDIADFRCIGSARLELTARNNLIYGPNGSGKTSLLEAIGFLSRGRSFRGTRTDGLVRHGAGHFTVAAVVHSGDREHRLGVEAGRGHLAIRVDRQSADSLAALAEKLAVQVIDPEIHRLVSDGPEVRRRFLDYGVFHVEHVFLDAWRRYRRALRQRNAALREGLGDQSVKAWEPELIAAGETVDDLRRRHVAALSEAFVELGKRLLAGSVACEYRSGWPEGSSLQAALDGVRSRDREQGTTTVGSHRADLRLVYRERSARQQVSRGQQKLFGAALVLAQTRLMAERLGDPPVLLVDDPAAELDRSSLAGLMGCVLETDSQLIVTALTEDAVSLPDGTRVFHVEHGEVTAAG